MEQRKRGRKRLGNKKRTYNVMLRFNDAEYDKLRRICESYNLEISERGVISPLLRRLVLNGNVEDKDRLPSTSNLAYHINKIGNKDHKFNNLEGIFIMSAAILDRAQIRRHFSDH